MADCYDSDARFRDIAFDLKGRKHIQAMWHMICQGDIRATFEVVEADQDQGQVNLIDEYTFRSDGAAGRRVHNVIKSRFRFRNGWIVEQRDYCDARRWADMAIGGVSGFLAGRLRFLRSGKAQEKLNNFMKSHPEYR
jgi:hypothetical protein